MSTYVYIYVTYVHTHAHIHICDWHALPVGQPQGFQALFWCGQSPCLWYRKPWVWLACHDMLEFVPKEVRRSHCYRGFLVPSYCQGSVGTGCSLRARNGDWGGPPRGSRAGPGSLSHPTAPAREQDSRGGHWGQPKPWAPGTSLGMGR